MAYAQSEGNLLSMLNDDCIYKILEWLSLEDLCSCTRTCKRLQALCDNHFRRKLPKEVTIHFGFDGKLVCEKYVNDFNNFIKKLKIVAGPFSENPLQNKLVANFVKAKCDPNLHKITIYGNMELVPFCKEIENFLHKVEIVQFWAGRGRDQSTFLKYCPNMTTLSIDHLWHEETIYAILGQKYPKLKHFHCLAARSIDFKAEKLKTFLQENDNIQCMEWSFYPSIDQQEKEAVECIRTVVEFALNLEHLFLGIDKVLTERFKHICDCLKVLSDRENFKSLHLKIDERVSATNLLTLHAKKLANFKQLTKIHICGKGLRLIDLVRALSPLVHLKSVVLTGLNFEYDWIQWSTIDELIALVDQTPNMALPQIEELTIEEGHEKLLLTYVMQLARRWVNLKKISLHNSRLHPFSGAFHIAELNRARTKLKKACELTIFTDDMGNATNLDHKLVKLKCMKFESMKVEGHS